MVFQTWQYGLHICTFSGLPITDPPDEPGSLRRPGSYGSQRLLTDLLLLEQFVVLAFASSHTIELTLLI